MSEYYEPETLAYYNDKVVSMEYVKDPKRRFSLACARVLDNAKQGYVLEGRNLYFLSPKSRLAKIVRDPTEKNTIVEIINDLHAHA